ncbi:hypothetical protein FB451DRAFT_1443437 [Mycena latifolia]|nr:hypothetical protein FB451DRAFT_1443437 [Mycena latifolia]
MSVAPASETQADKRLSESSEVLFQNSGESAPKDCFGTMNGSRKWARVGIVLNFQEKTGARMKVKTGEDVQAGKCRRDCKLDKRWTRSERVPSRISSSANVLAMQRPEAKVCDRHSAFAFGGRRGDVGIENVGLPVSISSSLGHPKPWVPERQIFHECADRRGAVPSAIDMSLASRSKHSVNRARPPTYIYAESQMRQRTSNPQYRCDAIELRQKAAPPGGDFQTPKLCGMAKFELVDEGRIKPGKSCRQLRYREIRSIEGIRPRRLNRKPRVHLRKIPRERLNAVPHIQTRSFPVGNRTYATHSPRRRRAYTPRPSSRLIWNKIGAAPAARVVHTWPPPRRRGMFGCQPSHPTANLSCNVSCYLRAVLFGHLGQRRKPFVRELVLCGNWLKGKLAGTCRVQAHEGLCAECNMLKRQAPPGPYSGRRIYAPVSVLGISGELHDQTVLLAGQPLQHSAIEVLVDSRDVSVREDIKPLAPGWSVRPTAADNYGMEPSKPNLHALQELGQPLHQRACGRPAAFGRDSSRAKGFSSGAGAAAARESTRAGCSIQMQYDQSSRKLTELRVRARNTGRSRPSVGAGAIDMSGHKDPGGKRKEKKGRHGPRLRCPKNHLRSAQHALKSSARRQRDLEERDNDNTPPRARTGRPCGRCTQLNVVSQPSYTKMKEVTSRRTWRPYRTISFGTRLEAAREDPGGERRNNAPPRGRTARARRDAGAYLKTVAKPFPSVPGFLTRVGVVKERGKSKLYMHSSSFNLHMQPPQLSIQFGYLGEPIQRFMSWFELDKPKFNHSALIPSSTPRPEPIFERFKFARWLDTEFPLTILQCIASDFDKVRPCIRNRPTRKIDDPPLHYTPRRIFRHAHSSVQARQVSTSEEWWVRGARGLASAGAAAPRARGAGFVCSRTLGGRTPQAYRSLPEVGAQGGLYPRNTGVGSAPTTRCVLCVFVRARLAPRPRIAAPKCPRAGCTPQAAHAHRPAHSRGVPARAACGGGRAPSSRSAALRKAASARAVRAAYVADAAACIALDYGGESVRLALNCSRAAAAPCGLRRHRKPHAHTACEFAGGPARAACGAAPRWGGVRAGRFGSKAHLRGRINSQTVSNEFMPRGRETMGAWSAQLDRGARDFRRADGDEERRVDGIEQSTLSARRGEEGWNEMREAQVGGGYGTGVMCDVGSTARSACSGLGRVVAGRDAAGGAVGARPGIGGDDAESIAGSRGDTGGVTWRVAGAVATRGRGGWQRGACGGARCDVSITAAGAGNWEHSVASGGAGALHRGGVVAGWGGDGGHGGTGRGGKGCPTWPKLASEHRAGGAGPDLEAPRSMWSGANGGWVTGSGKKLIVEGRMGQSSIYSEEARKAGYRLVMFVELNGQSTCKTERNGGNIAKNGTLCTNNAGQHEIFGEEGDICVPLMPSISGSSRTDGQTVF